ncbi:MAG: S8 family serine peptidase [Bradyrhizobium sp.]
MIQNGANWRMKMRHRALALIAAILPLACFGSTAGHAQSIMRSPNLNITSRIPTIRPNLAARTNPNVTARVNHDIRPRINPNVAGRAVTSVGVSTLRIRPDCGYAYRESSGDCSDQPVVSGDGGNGRLSGKSRGNDPGGTAALAALNLPPIPNEIVTEIDGALSDAQADTLARRHGLRRVESQNFPFIGATIGLFRITDRRTVETASRELGADPGVRSVQPNFRYLLQDQNTELTEGDPAQYANAILRLPQAHTLAHGANVTVAVIDSGVDVKHPEFASAMIVSFDALGSKEGPHVHGTGVAGAIVSHARLMGSAPAARILAIRAFGAAPKGAESTSYVILKGLGYAAAHGAQIVNMSFAGPKDALIERGIAALAAKGIVMVAAAGNAGPKSPPLYPAADTNVIAVSATDAQDKLFAASNRGGYIAISAPGVEIFLPAPDEKYQMTSGTSFSAAYISGLAALMLERNPALKPDEVRAILMKTARDLGPPGRDDQFGAGEADAFAAVSAASTSQAVPVAEVSAKPATGTLPDRQEVSPTRALNQPVATTASDKPAEGEPKPAAGDTKPAAGEVKPATAETKPAAQ